VAVPSKNGTVVALLDARGKVPRGWPVLLRRATGCQLDADPADGTVRAVCSVGRTVRAYALDAAGRRMTGWPVTLPAGDIPSWRSDPVRIVDGALYVVLVRHPPADDPLSTSATVFRVSRDGSLRTGVSLRDHDLIGCCATIGPDGAAYLVSAGAESLITALTLSGLRPGYPIRIDGLASAPAFGPSGRLFVTVEATDASGEVLADSRSKVAAFAGDGSAARGWPVDVPFDAWKRSGDGGAFVEQPVTAPDGTVYVYAITRTRGTLAFAIGPGGRPRQGWPYTSSRSLVTPWSGNNSTCLCEPCVVPDLFIDTSPLAGPGGTLLLVDQQRGDEIVSGGSRLVAVRPDGKMKPGWPVTLGEKRSWFASVAAGAGGFVYGYAVEPAGSRRNSCGEKDAVYSGTIVALDGHGDTVYTTTIVAP